MLGSSWICACDWLPGRLTAVRKSDVVSHDSRKIVMPHTPTVYGRGGAMILLRCVQVLDCEKNTPEAALLEKIEIDLSHTLGEAEAEAAAANAGADAAAEKSLVFTRDSGRQLATCTDGASQMHVAIIIDFNGDLCTERCFRLSTDLSRAIVNIDAPFLAAEHAEGNAFVADAELISQPNSRAVAAYLLNVEEMIAAEVDQRLHDDGRIGKFDRRAGKGPSLELSTQPHGIGGAIEHDGCSPELDR